MRGLLVLSVVAALAFAACGDDSDDAGVGDAANGAAAGNASDSSSGQPLDKQEYEARYQELGDEAQAAIDEIGATAQESDPNDVATISAAFEDFAEVTADIAARLDELEPPGDIADEHQGYVDVLNATADAYGEIADATADAADAEAARGELARLQELFQEPDINRAVVAFAKAVKKGRYDLGFELEPGQPVPGATP